MKNQLKMGSRPTCKCVFICNQCKSNMSKSLPLSKYRFDKPRTTSTTVYAYMRLLWHFDGHILAWQIDLVHLISTKIGIDMLLNPKNERYRRVFEIFSKFMIGAFGQR